jgi:hypothetical protein
VSVKFRAMNLVRGSEHSANRNLAFAVANALQASPYLDKEGTKLEGDLEAVDENTGTFAFTMKLQLKEPGEVHVGIPNPTVAPTAPTAPTAPAAAAPASEENNLSSTQ